MWMLRKISPLYFFLTSETFTQVLKVSSYPFHLTRCLIPDLLRLRTILSIWNSVWGYNVLHKIVIVKLAFYRTSLQIWEVVNRLWQALNNIDNPKLFCWKGLFIPLRIPTFSFVIITRYPTLYLALPWGSLALRLFIFCHTD